MGRIFCLMGKSSSGKDTLFEKLKYDKELNLKVITSYTTRPMRSKERDGVQYHFITEKRLDEYEKSGLVIEKRAYNTVEGIWYYATINDGQTNLEKNNYIVIGTLEVFSGLKDFFGRRSVVPIYIDLDDGTRLSRALQRELQQSNPNYEELCRRFLADNVDFSLDNLKINNITKSYMNYDLEKCFNEIKADILK